MLDLSVVRNHPDRVRRAIRDKGLQPVEGGSESPSGEVDRFLRLDEQRRILLQKVETLRHQRNVLSGTIGRLRQTQQETYDQVAGMKRLKEQMKVLEDQIRSVESGWKQALLHLPNIPAPSVPVGHTTSDNRFVRSWGDIPHPDFRPFPHWELGERLGIVDLPRAGLIAGMGFPLLKGLGARLQRALGTFMLDLHTEQHGYIEVQPPYLARRLSLMAAGQLPRMEPCMYRCEADDLFLIPAPEVPLTNLHQGEILAADALPLRYVACTPCFRREAGSYGTSTRGLIRLHQFDQVQLVKFVRPETSDHELERLVQDAEEVLRRLELPYRVMELCTGQLSFAAARGYAIEVWAAGVQRYLEVSTCTSFTDFQSRRANIRYRPDRTSKAQWVHTVNGSALALPRTLIALMENHQTAEGSIRIPEALKLYMGGCPQIG